MAQVSKQHYSYTYDHKARWISYWYQIRSVLAFAPQTVAEIGIGNALTTNYLKSNEVNVTTIDIDPELHPDVCASVTALTVADLSFDVVLAAEILEHIPFHEVPKALSEIFRVCKMGAVITVPDSRRTLAHFGAFFPKLGFKELFLKIDTQRPHQFDGQHYWELGKKGYSVSTLKKLFVEAGFTVKKDFVPSDVPTKHFFILQK